MTKVIQQMDMTKAAKLFFTNYFDFSGRASRGEFWWAYLAFFIVSIIIAILDGEILGMIFGFTDNVCSNFRLMVAFTGQHLCIPSLEVALHEIDITE